MTIDAPSPDFIALVFDLHYDREFRRGYYTGIRRGGQCRCSRCRKIEGPLRIIGTTHGFAAGYNAGKFVRWHGYAKKGLTCSPQDDSLCQVPR